MLELQFGINSWRSLRCFLSVLPKVHGGITRWFFLISFTIALLHLRWGI